MSRPAVWKVLVILAALLASPASGGDEGEQGDEHDEEADIEEDALDADKLRLLHGKFDGNGDGKVSLQEIIAYSHTVGAQIAHKDVSSILEEIDTSKDGLLSLEEHLDDISKQQDEADASEQKELAIRKDFEKAKFQAADSNGDKVLDRSEVAALFYPETHEGVLSVTVADTMRQKDVDKDGKLSPREFWEGDDAEGGENMDLSEEEMLDFEKLDKDRDGFLDSGEFTAWESGRFHTENFMETLIALADKNSDRHITVDELADARKEIAGSDAHYHLLEWAEHHEL